MALSVAAALGGAGAVAGEVCVVTPRPYEHALRNPLKGFTTLNGRTGHEWATLTHQYVRWNEIENAESDGIEKIRAFCDAKWREYPALNVKVIPRVYLHWSGDGERYWPSDMTPGDYTSPQFRRRVLRLIERLGELWDDDPRVAFVELGIFGKWGEHHSPSPTPEMQALVADAFAKAFRKKLVSVRHAWSEFTGQPFGEYWDSWAHYQQMWVHGMRIRELNERTGRWKAAYIGGETAYNWGLSKTQPGDDPTDSVADPAHREFIVNTIRWLHCTQLRWIGEYDARNAQAREGAEAVQRALGYRFVLGEVRFTPRVDARTPLRVSFSVTNEGAAPFYYEWPVEVSLLDPATREVAWKGRFAGVDIRTWLPGDGWTDPDWIDIADWPKKAPRPDWSRTAAHWRVPPKPYKVEGTFDVRARPGRYVLALAVLDPAGMVPSLRFATANYLRGGRHPLGVVAVGEGAGGPLPRDFRFDDPHEDASLHYVAGRR